MIEKVAMQSGFSLQPMAEINDTNLLLQMVRTGDWISILSQHSVDGHPELRAIPLKEKGGSMQVSILQSKGRYEKWLPRNLSKSFKKSFLIRIYRKRLNKCL